MEILLVIIGVVVLIIIMSKSKGKQPITNQTSNPTQNEEKFTTDFPDRTASIGFFQQTIETSIQNGDIDIANLNFAKLVESLRQQNINEKGALEKDFEYAKQKYFEFRNFYNVDYPQQFLSPEERKKAQSKYDNDYVLLTTLNYDELPKQVLKHIDKIKTVKEWRELRLSPKKEQYGDWKPLKRQERYFDFESIEQIDKYKEIIKLSKRITKNPYFISALIEQGCEISEFAYVGEDINHFILALNKQEEEDFENSLLSITKAIAINPLDDYIELESDLKASLGDEDTIQQKFKKYEYDIDSPIHTSEIYSWFKGLIKKGKYELTVFYIKKTINIIDKLISGEIEHQIYIKQRTDFYIYEKERFQKDILIMIKGVELPTTSNNDEELSALLILIGDLYIGKQTSSLEYIGDTLVKLKRQTEAKTIFLKCLTMIKDGDKPRVKTRLQNKINEIN